MTDISGKITRVKQSICSTSSKITKKEKENDHFSTEYCDYSYFDCQSHGITNRFILNDNVQI